ncbi:unnamed protein product [Cochlearia groenlandica]
MLQPVPPAAPVSSQPASSPETATYTNASGPAEEEAYPDSTPSLAPETAPEASTRTRNKHNTYSSPQQLRQSRRIRHQKKSQNHITYSSSRTTIFSVANGMNHHKGE